MFTLEESALLGFMLRFVGWMLLVVLVAAGSVAGVHWMHRHPHSLAVHHQMR